MKTGHEMTTMRFCRMLHGLVFTAGTGLCIGCSAPPVAEVDAAHVAFQEAKLAGAPILAAPLWDVTRESILALDEELRSQEEKFALMRRYDTTMELARAANQAAVEARSIAEHERLRLDPILGNTLERLVSTELSAQQTAELAEAVTAWRNSTPMASTNPDYVPDPFAESPLANAVYEVARVQGVTSHVELLSRPKDGATVRYQTIEQRKRGEPPFTAKGLTSCMEEMTTGHYHIWAVRDGRTTSDPESVYRIIRESETVELREGGSGG